MDPIHPIRPSAAYPSAVDAVRRLTRAGEDPPDEQRPRRERRKALEPAPQPAVTADGQLDVRA